MRSEGYTGERALGRLVPGTLLYQWTWRECASSAFQAVRCRDPLVADVHTDSAVSVVGDPAACSTKPLAMCR
jgi:hypothetical protein